MPGRTSVMSPAGTGEIVTPSDPNFIFRGLVTDAPSAGSTKNARGPAGAGGGVAAAGAAVSAGLASSAGGVEHAAIVTIRAGRASSARFLLTFMSQAPFQAD